jgi:ketosteroid isomerase-like protein
MKKITASIVTVFLFCCCSKHPGKNEQLITKYFDHFNNHEWSEMAAMYSDTADFKDPSLGPGIVKQTRQQTEVKYSALEKMFSGLRDSIVSIYPSGDQNIIVEFVAKGKAPDGSFFELPVCTVFTIENGQITKDFTYFDNF